MSRLNLALWLALLAALGAAVVKERAAAWRRHGNAKVIQTVTPAGEVDRCPTCHRATVDPKQVGSAPPLKPHPAVPGHARVAELGCSSCHGGQGRRLDMQAHGPALGGGPSPFLTGSWIQARCVRCHLPGRLAGAKVLEQGLAEYRDGACNGCHKPGRVDQGLGPDLSRLGRRTEAELDDALLRPRRGHPGATMWSVQWRFRGPKARQRLTALKVALLSMVQRAEPYRSAWTTPQASTAAACAGCHQEVQGGRTAGPAHRCAGLLQAPELRCARCHGDEATRVAASARGDCPQVRAARPQCAMCHLHRTP